MTHVLILMLYAARHTLLRLFLAVAMTIATAFVGHAQIDTDQVLTIGRNAMFFDDYMVAIRYFNQVIDAKPYLARPYFYRAIAKLSLDDFAGAEADATTAIEKNPFIVDAYEVRAVARQNLGMNNAAIADYERVLADKPDSRNVLSNLAIARLDIHDDEGAERTFNTLISRFPRYDGGYTARARMNLTRGDTISALADISKAIELNANSVNAYVMRANISVNSEPRDYKSALDDMDMAVKLQPQSPGMYINRAFLRYNTDDYIGAMADYDYALQLDPVNIIALYNRAMLRAEVHDYNRAIADFSDVLRQNPDQYRALFNRANLYREIGDYDKAYADINRVITAFPDFAAAIYLRGDIQYRRGNAGAADRDFKQSVALARKRVVTLPDQDIGAAAADGDQAADRTLLEEDQDVVAARFSSLLLVDNLSSTPREFENGSTRGSIQNTDFSIRLEPLYFFSYYAEPTELKMSTDFVREIDELNSSHTLPQQLLVVTREPALSDADIAAHENSIERYSRRFAQSPSTVRPVDYLGRAIDRMALRDYNAAIEDLDTAIVASPDFVVALLMRGVARWRLAEIAKADPDRPSDPQTAMLHRATVDAALADLDEVLRLSPSMAIAWYDRGCILAAEGDYSAADSAFSHAIDLKDDLGEAWYNRGYVRMMLGHKADAFTDLSRAGQLGIAPSYSLLRRMAR